MSPSGEPLLRWNVFFENGPVPTMICDAKTCAFLAVNKAAERAYGYPRAEFLAMTIRDLGGSCNGEAERIEHTGSYRYRRRDATTLHVEMTAQPVCFEDEAGSRPAWLIYAVDVSERREMEARFLRVQRLECIGMLASGVAHDLNNVLAPIMMSASVLRGGLTGPALDEFLSVIEQSAQRGVKLLRQVLTFVKGVEGGRVPMKIEPVIREVVEMARQTFPGTVGIEHEYPEDPEEGLWEIRGDATKLHQVFMNLALNARDAMPHGGKLVILTRNREIESAGSTSHAGLPPCLSGAEPGRYVQVSFRDTGIGIPEAVRRKLFTPFFTTKPPEKGTGLGLATVLGILKSHGGLIGVESEEGKGASFTLLLPTADAPSEPPPSQGPGPDGEGKTILVVDDEAGIRKLVKAILERAGYEVVAVGSGNEAMAEYIRRPGEIKLVLVDLIMPSMDGLTLARAIKSLDPDAVIIATSGAESESRLQELRALGVTRFLKKPYQALDLLAAVE